MGSSLTASQSSWTDRPERPEEAKG